MSNQSTELQKKEPKELQKNEPPDIKELIRTGGSAVTLTIGIIGFIAYVFSLSPLLFIPITAVLIALIFIGLYYYKIKPKLNEPETDDENNSIDTKSIEASNKESSLSPNIVCLDSGMTMIEEDEKGVFVLGGQTKFGSGLKIDKKPDLLSALFVELGNDPVSNKKVLPVKDIQAQVFYFSKGSKLAHRVHEGVWLGRKSSLVSFGVGDKQDLILGIVKDAQKSDGKYFVACDNKRLPSGERFEMNYRLPQELIVYVRLFNKKDGVMLKTFKIQVNCNEKISKRDLQGREIESKYYTYGVKCLGESEIPNEN